MLVKVSTTIVIITDSGKELIRTTGKASSTMSSGVDAQHKKTVVEKVTEQASQTAKTGVDGALSL